MTRSNKLFKKHLSYANMVLAFALERRDDLRPGETSDPHSVTASPRGTHRYIHCAHQSEIRTALGKQLPDQS